MDTQHNDTDFDLFDAAFDEAVKDLPSGEEPAVGKATDGDAKGGGTDPLPPAGTDAPASADAADASSTPAADKAIEGGEASEASDAAAAETPAKAADTAPDYARQTVDLLDQLVKKGTSPAPADAASDKAPPAADISQAHDAAEPEPFKLSDEQAALLKTFDDEWPEIAKASALRTEMAVRIAVGGLVKQLRTELAPMVAHWVKNVGDSHTGSIRAAHNDFDTLKPQVLEWIGKQPAGIRSAYTAVAKDGSAEDVIELVNIYKNANGLGTPAVGAESADASVTPDKKPAPEVQKAAASLAVIPGRRPGVLKGSVDKNDFDDAWR